MPRSSFPIPSSPRDVLRFIAFSLLPLFPIQALSGQGFQVAPLPAPEFGTERTIVLDFEPFSSGTPAADLYASLGLKVIETDDYRAVTQVFSTGVLGIRNHYFIRTEPISEAAAAEGGSYTVILDFDLPLQRVGLQLDQLPGNAPPSLERLSALDGLGGVIGSIEAPTTIGGLSEFPSQFWGLEAMGERSISRILLEGVEDVLSLAQLRFDFAREPVFTSFLAQVGQGAVPGGVLRTTITVTNPSPLQAQAQLSLVGSDGAAMDLELNGTASSQFRLELEPFSSIQLRTRGEELLTGYARLESNLPLQASAAFAVVLADGSIASEAGVSATAPFFLLNGAVERDSQLGIDSGIALANPSEEEAVLFVLPIAADGTPGDRGSRFTLPPRGHAAMFLGELLGDSIEADFTGSIRIVSRLPIAAVVLRTSLGRVSSSLPVATTERP